MSGVVAPITLVTGLPGSGKTAKVVELLAFHEDFKNRPLFVMGIPELQIEHNPTPPLAEWTELRPSPEDPNLELPYFTFPAGSVIVIDEAQRIFRPRSTGSRVPDYVAAFETVRHGGVDFILLTQHPGLIDSNLRKLVGRHMHIHVAPMGRYLLEWRGCKDPESKTDRELATRQKYAPPKRVFDLYKSAEKHTKVSVSIPWQYYVFFAAALVMLVVAYYGYQRISNKTISSTPTDSKPATQSPDLKGATAAAYVAAYKPRVEGLQHTAPVYDEITKPQDVPWPSACMKTSKACRCYDQQGNNYPTTPAVCGQIIANGLFKPYADKPNGSAASDGRGAAPAGAQQAQVVALAQPANSLQSSLHVSR